ncbi:HAD-IC family P-type ATPase [Candidatus Gracilibacteria bacterium]|nr:HAD-IC family P-type ATPase [Candidatus Gracilibacteria bacterium]MCF7898616.1 HAD-IC family P-type ATPase [Candidatus Paceibacterota bacterium]
MDNDLQLAITALKPWSTDTGEVIETMSSASGGISEKEAEVRLGIFGENNFYNTEKTSMFNVFVKQFKSPLIFLLVIAGVITLFLSEYINSTVIFLAVFINAGLGFYREYQAENTLDKLSTYIKDRAVVIRGGKEFEIDSTLLVPGDVIKLSYGKRVPADARIMSVNNLRVDEAVLTGESAPIEKTIGVVSITSSVSDRTNMVHAGTLVVEGYARAIVHITGNDTEIGKIAGIVSKIDRADSPIQKGVEKLAWMIFFLTLVIVAGIFVLGISRGEGLIEMLILSIAVAVGAVPEALPIALTVILAVGAERIASKKGIVRKLAAAETLGSTTLIMTDKTGTLTLADMQLVGIFSHENMLTKSEAHESKHFSEEQKKLLEYAIHNLDVSVENAEEEPTTWSFRGRPFEVNIAKAAVSHGVGADVLIMDRQLLIPFNSTHKFSVSETDEHYIVMGAPDILLKKSLMTKDEYMISEEWIDHVSKEGNRLIGIALIDKKQNHDKISLADIKDMKFMGVLALHDPIREEVPEAIRTIEGYGIKMVLVTGDLKGTALAVAKSLGWAVKDEEVLTGPELSMLSDDELITVIPNIKIFARITPEDKLRVGQLYRSLGEVVAMTGDGVNDAPALKAMDIGVSLGSGSDVAKSAADMVLLDDNFQTISLAIGEGRKILTNIRKTFVYLMSNSLDEVLVVGGSLIVGLSLPLTALQIIWVNLFTGSLPALAFAFDDNLDKTKRETVISSKLIFTKEVKVLTFGIGIFSSILLFAAYYWLVLSGVEIELAKSIFFVCFASYILAVAYSFRSLHSPLFSYSVFSNVKLNWAIVIASTILILTVTVPFMQNIFSLVSIPFAWMWFIVGWVILNVMLVEGAKYIFRKGWI